MNDNQTMHPRITKGIEALFGRLESLAPDGAKVHFARLCEAIAQRMEGPDPYPFDGLADAACELDILTYQLAGPDVNPPLLFGGRVFELPDGLGAAWLVMAGITTSDQQRRYAFPIASFSLVGDPPRPRGIRVPPVEDVDAHNRDQLAIAFRNWAAWASDLERVDLEPFTQEVVSAAIVDLQNNREDDYIVRTFCRYPAPAAELGGIEAKVADALAKYGADAKPDTIIGDVRARPGAVRNHLRELEKRKQYFGFARKRPDRYNRD